jgi:hypothetical protein
MQRDFCDHKLRFGVGKAIYKIAVVSGLLRLHPKFKWGFGNDEQTVHVLVPKQSMHPR